jgi:transcriptional regulator with XRE-family HTH domain
MSYASAAARQADARRERDYRAGRLVPYPRQITAALDLHSLYGPEVDRACLAEEPAVDEWEAGRAVPTWEQLSALAELTGMPMSFFFAEPPAEIGPTFMCNRGRGGKCEVIPPREPVPRFGEQPKVVPLFPERLF